MEGHSFMTLTMKSPTFKTITLFYFLVFITKNHFNFLIFLFFYFDNNCIEIFAVWSISSLCH